MAVTILKLNFRGVYFEVDVNILQRAPESRLANIARGKERVPMDNEGRHFIDRNPVYFHHILNYYNTGRLEFPPQYSWDAVKAEIDFWMLDANALSKTCALRYERDKAQLKVAEDINQYYHRYDLMSRGTVCKGCAKVFKGMYMFFDVPRSSIPSMLYSIIVCVILPVFSYVCHALLTIPSFKVYRLVNVTDNAEEILAIDKFSMSFDTFVIIELVVVGVIILEMLLRFICWPAKCRFFEDPLNWADFIGGVIPFIYWLLLFLKIYVVAEVYIVAMLVKSLPSFRLLRIFRIWRGFDAYRALILAITYSVKDLFLTFAISLILVVFFALFLFAADSNYEHGYQSIPDYLWMVVITMTTVGYGDHRPTSFRAKIIGVICAFSGILVIVLPVTSLVNNFSVAWKGLRMARVLRKYKSGKTKEYMIEVPQQGMPMYPVLPPEAGMHAASTASSGKEAY